MSSARPGLEHTAKATQHIAAIARINSRDRPIFAGRSPVKNPIGMADSTVAGAGGWGMKSI